MRKRLNLVSKIKNAMVHSFRNDRLIVSSRNSFFELCNFENPELKLIGSIPWNGFQKVFKFRSVDRILNNNIRLVHKANNGDYLVCNPKGWWSYDATSMLLKAQPALSGTRPLAKGVCRGEDGSTYISEYSLNPDRKEVKIFRFDKSANLEVVHVFEKHTIRHIHGLIRDRVRKGRIWVLTGDNDDESHFYYTDDHFNSLNLFLSARQLSRAVDIVFRGKKIIWGTDSPDQQNYIMQADIDNPDKYEFIAPLPGPVYYTCQNMAGATYFATTAEPGPASEKKHARIFSLSPGNKIREVHNCSRDLIPQHGIIYFPSGVLPENYVIFSQKALKPNEGCTIIARDESSQ